MATPTRPILATFESGKQQIKYFATIADEIECAHKFYGCLCPCTAMWYEPLSKELRQSTYVEVLENRIEYNYPYSVVTCSFPDCWRINCQVVDNTGVIYFDRAVIANAAVAEPCAPSCTHNSCTPTCFGMFGESVVLYEDVPGMGACCGGSCAHMTTCCHVQNVGVNAPGVMPRACCVAQHVSLPCIRNAKGLAAAINDARAIRLTSQDIKVEAQMAR
jgi:hypothetical protein